MIAGSIYACSRLELLEASQKASGPLEGELPGDMLGFLK